MTTVFVIIVILASVILGLIVLVQNPKGGGLAGNIAGFSNQFMGVKQTTDVLEKGTWLFAGLIAALSMFSVVFISKSAGGNTPDRTNDAKGAPVPANNTTTNPNNTLQLNPGGTVTPTK